MDLIREMLDALEDPQMRHAVIVHAPTALAFLGLPLVVVMIAWPKNHVARWVTIAAYAILTIAAYFASESGHDAESQVSAAITAEGDEILDDHHYWGERAWWLAAGVTTLLLVTAAPKKIVRVTAGIVALAAALVMAGWIAVVGHWGGTLVYQHGAVAARAAPFDGQEPSNGAEDDSTVEPLDARVTFFLETVQPILEEKCWGCHNPQRAERFAGLDLTTIASVLKGGESAPDQPAVVPGHPEASLVIEAIRYEGFLQMPPSRAGGKLPDDQIAAIERWIAEGAVWGDFEPPAAFERPPDQ